MKNKTKKTPDSQKTKQAKKVINKIIKDSKPKKTKDFQKNIHPSDELTNLIIKEVINYHNNNPVIINFTNNNNSTIEVKKCENGNPNEYNVFINKIDDIDRELANRFNNGIG